MSNLVTWARRQSSRSSSPWPSISLDQLPALFGQFGYQGIGYGPTMIQTIQQNRETISADFTGFINGAYKTNGAVFACILTRLLLFSDARFQYRRLNNGRPGKLFGTQDLQILERPWPNATTGDLLAKAIVDVDLAGNFYATRVKLQQRPQPALARLRPDWVTIILGTKNNIQSADQWDPSAELVGYVYEPGGPGSGSKPIFYLPEEVMHWAPIPDPTAHYRGMSWVQPVLNEVLGDRAMTVHKDMYFTNGATPNLVVSMDTGKMNRESFKEWVDMFENEHEGAMNAYKTLYLGHGSTATVVGSSIKDLDYAVVQGHGETRIAAAAGVPPIIVGFSEGLEAATYSNYAQARRAFADKTLRPLWRNFAGSMETLVPAPGSAQLWYDDRDIPFLQDDANEKAEVQLTRATAMRLLVDAGYDADSVVDAMEANDFSLLTHSGLFSVQLRPPGSQDPNQQGDGDQQGDGKGDGEGDQQGDGEGDGQGKNGNGNGAKTNGYLEVPGRLRVAGRLGHVKDPVALAKALLDAPKETSEQS